MAKNKFKTLPNEGVDSDPMECWCDACQYAQKLDKVVLKYETANLIINCTAEELRKSFMENREGSTIITKKFQHEPLEVGESGLILMSDEYPINEH
jgi:hypothetical protein